MRAKTNPAAILPQSDRQSGQLRVAVAVILMCVMVMLGARGCEDAAPQQPPPPPDVVVVEVRQADVPIYREWVGTLAGDVNATISAQVSGYLISREYNEGSVVKKGQVLFHIDPAPFQSALAKSKAQL